MPETAGCVYCGKPLVYADTPSAETCLVCGKTFDALAKCEDGHYICDGCHGADILTKAGRLLADSEEHDPVALLGRLFVLPGLNMHGPEYHSLVPAALVTAYQNKTGKRDLKAIKEALRRGKDIKGGSCGYCGTCGSAAGAGIAAAVLGRASPMSDTERGGALKMTGRALLAVGEHGGPRCCKREAVTSVESFMKHSGYFEGMDPSGYVCRQSGKNKDCIGARCPYNPAHKPEGRRAGLCVP